MENQLPRTTLFLICIYWYGHIRKDMEKGYIENVVSKEKKKCIVIKEQPYTLQDEVLYKLELNGILCQCLNPYEAQ
jgi:uncharacterized protein (UPF0128 family)